MRIGTRWRCGDDVPPAVPEALRARIAAEEAASAGAPHAVWTLTWLEGRPRVTRDGTTVLTLAPDGTALTEQASDPATASGVPFEEDDEAWLRDDPVAP